MRIVAAIMTGFANPTAVSVERDRGRAIRAAVAAPRVRTTSCWWPARVTSRTRKSTASGIAFDDRDVARACPRSAAMLNIDLALVANSTHGRLHRKAGCMSPASPSTAARLEAGALFVALRGEHHDAHDFVDSAAANGAVAALVEREVDVDAAAGHRRRHRTRARRSGSARCAPHREVCVIGITGSNGKTTVKTPGCRRSLRGTHRTHVNSGSFNNEIGLPLTLLAMPADSRIRGARNGRRQARRHRLPRAHRAVRRSALVNNVAPAHLERMGSVDGVAETKGALYAGLPADGIAVINADDAYARLFRGARRHAAHPALRPGARRRRQGASVRTIPRLREFTLVYAAGRTLDIDCRLSGRHNVLNALAAASDRARCRGTAGNDQGRARAGPRRSPGASRVDAHPSGADDDRRQLQRQPRLVRRRDRRLAAAAGRRDPGRGRHARTRCGRQRACMRDIGALARGAGIDGLYAVGELSRRGRAQAFGDGAVTSISQAALIDALRRGTRAGVSLLVKGSRGSAMDRWSHALFAVNRSREGDMLLELADLLT